jgi:hypothetical protein
LSNELASGAAIDFSLNRPIDSFRQQVLVGVTAGARLSE